MRKFDLQKPEYERVTGNCPHEAFLNAKYYHGEMTEHGRVIGTTVTRDIGNTWIVEYKFRKDDDNATVIV